MQAKLLDDIRKLVRPLRQQMLNIVARATVKLVNDAAGRQVVQLGVLDGETVDDGERFQDYGFTSVPVEGAEAVVVFPGGDRGHPIVIAVDGSGDRPTGLEPGEVAVYNNTGAKIVMTKDGDIVCTPASGRHVLLGGDAAADPPALKSDLQTLYNAISTAIPSPLDGGANLQLTLLQSLNLALFPVGAQKVKAE